MHQRVTCFCLLVFLQFLKNANPAGDTDIFSTGSSLEERLLELQYQNTRLQLELLKARKEAEGRRDVAPTNIIIYTELASEIRNLRHECSDAKSKASGVYQLTEYAASRPPLSVYCDFDVHGGGWTYIHRRVNGTLNFNRPWADYKNGFGNVNGEHWLGLEHVHLLTAREPHELLIMLEDHEDGKRWAKYDNFYLSDESEHYALNRLGAYTGDAGDSLTGHLTEKFSTIDVDNDAWKEGNCANTYKGGWWFNRCLTSNLNGAALIGEFSKSQCCRGIHWLNFRGNQYSLKKAQMLIRPKSYKA